MLRRERNFDRALSQLASMRAFLHETCREGCPPAASDEQLLPPLELAVTEAASNIILHATQEEPHPAIAMTIDVSDSQVAVMLRYRGDSFDRGASPEPAFDGSRENGFGLYLIDQCVDEVRYGQEEDGRRVVHLIRKRNQSHPGADHASHH